MSKINRGAAKVVSTIKMGRESDQYEKGQRIECFNNKGNLTQAVVKDNLSIQCFIEYDDGSQEFVWKKNIRALVTH